MGGGNAGSSDVKVVGQYRVFVTEALIAGQPVRASTGSAEYLVRVPEHALAGDSFVFKVTEQDIRLSSTNDDASNDLLDSRSSPQPQQQPQQHIIEGAVLDQKKSWRDRVGDLFPLFRHELATQVLCDPRRIVLLSAALALSLCSGFIVGSLVVTSDIYCSKCTTAAARNSIMMAQQAA